MKKGSLVEISFDTGQHIASVKDYEEKFKTTRVGTKPSCSFQAKWFWEEDALYISKHDQSMIAPSTSFVMYFSDDSDEIETLYQSWKRTKKPNTPSFFYLGHQKVRNAHTGSMYELRFDTMTQTNKTSNFERAIRREVHFKSNPYDNTKELPPLPNRTNLSLIQKLLGETNNPFKKKGEDFLPTFHGQVIAIVKTMSSKQWLYGKIMCDANKGRVPQKQSGWFPAILCRPASAGVIVNALSSAGLPSLMPPATWDSGIEGTVEVSRYSDEFREVVDYFNDKMYPYEDKNKVLRVDRVQTTDLWMGYAAKKEAMTTKYTKDPGSLVNNTNIKSLEKKWLFHGTCASSSAKIIKGGFNRAFAGRNATSYGKGVYFATTSSYSWKYTTPDPHGTRQMFLCRVAVGDYCAGNAGDLTPASKPGSSDEFFDSTVDRVSSPSIFVAYHDAQAYPEYLVTFRERS